MDRHAVNKKPVYQKKESTGERGGRGATPTNEENREPPLQKLEGATDFVQKKGTLFSEERGPYRKRLFGRTAKGGMGRSGDTTAKKGTFQGKPLSKKGANCWEKCGNNSEEIRTFLGGGEGPGILSTMWKTLANTRCTST